MGIFSKKPKYALSDILKGLQQAVSSATSMLQAQQMDNLSHFWTKDGWPITKKVQIGERELEVPIMALVSHNNLVMDDIEIKFKAVSVMYRPIPYPMFWKQTTQCRMRNFKWIWVTTRPMWTV